jgi:hypothetical protein
MAKNKYQYPPKEKVIYAATEEIIDGETGEIIRHRKFTSTLIDKEPPHVKIYLQDIAKINDLPPAAAKVLNILVQNMGYNNMVPMLKPFKEVICNTLDIKMNTLEKVIALLKEKQILHTFSRGLYILDPYLFAKGRWADIKNLRLIIEYDENGNRRLTSNAPQQIRQLSIKFD